MIYIEDATDKKREIIRVAVIHNQKAQTREVKALRFREVDNVLDFCSFWDSEYFSYLENLLLQWESFQAVQDSISGTCEMVFNINEHDQNKIHKMLVTSSAEWKFITNEKFHKPDDQVIRRIQLMPGPLQIPPPRLPRQSARGRLARQCRSVLHRPFSAQNWTAGGAPFDRPGALQPVQFRSVPQGGLRRVQRVVSVRQIFGQWPEESPQQRRPGVQHHFQLLCTVVLRAR